MSEEQLPTTKPSYLSKTLWINFILAGVALFVPKAHEFMMQHPEYVVYAFAGINILLRKFTKTGLELY
jgi:hypothetical protein